MRDQEVHTSIHTCKKLLAFKYDKLKVNLTNEAIEGIAPSMNVREDLRASF